MAWTPISGALPQYQKSDGTLASDYYLKFYKSGTSTPFSMATDDTGGTTLAKCQLNSSGYPTTDGSAEFIPYVDQKYKMALYQNSTDADADTLGSAEWVVDTLPQLETSSSDTWSLYTETPTRTANGAFTVTGDRTTTFTVGTRLRFTDNGNTYYGIVVASAYTTLTTVTCLVTANLTANLTDVYTETISDAGQAKSIHVDARTYLATADTTFTKTLKFDDGGLIDMQSNAMTFSGSPTIKAGLHQIFSNLGAVTGRCKLNAIYPEWFGAAGDDSTDDKAAFADTVTFAEGITGAARILLTQNYKVSVTKGTNDKWGINIKGSNITLELLDGATLRRSSTDISTYALSFPILLVGTPDSDVAAATDKFKLKGGEFIGEDTRHAIGGSSIMDGRQAVWVKNCTNAKFIGTTYSSMDSGAIYFQQPAVYDYENSAYYNSTKSYRCKVLKNTFTAASHSTAGRALIHAVVTTGLDRGIVSHNDSEWCDVFISSNGTYDDYDDLETDTYTDTNLGVAVKRRGRGLTVNSNTCYNSSEHSFYLESMAVSCQGNTIIVDDPTTCNTYQMQIRARGAAITGNEFWGVAAAASINVGSMDVTFASNTIQSLGDLSGGCINIQSNGLKAYIDARSDYFGSYKAMRNINVVGGSMTMPSASQTYGLAIRVYCSDDDAATFPNGEMIDLSITGMTICNAKVGFLFLGSETMMRNIKINGNTISGKLFTEGTFTTGTTMNSLSVLAIDDAAAYANGFRNVEFKGNTCYGFEYVVIDHDGAGGLGSGSAGSFYLPYGFNDNGFNYFKYFDTAAFRPVDVNNRFTDNRGQYFLERTAWYTASAINNSLNTGKSGNSGFKSCITLASSDNRAYYDDALSYDAL